MNNSNILNIYERLCDEVDGLKFSWPVAFVYNPLRYAWDGFRQYMRFADGHKRVVFVGMNPGPWGMAQTGVPFGEVNSVREFLGITSIRVFTPQDTQGLECGRSEVSGKRLWGLFRERFGTADSFFAENFVLNYCPLLFIGRTDKGSLRNLTPDKISPSERVKLCTLCDSALIEAVEILKPEHVIGIGNFAYSRAKTALIGQNLNVTKILHPSPANPNANSGWAMKAQIQLKSSGVWQ